MVFIVITACKRKSTEIPVTESVVEIIEEKKLPELQAGEEFYKSTNPFGETILLTGNQVFIDTVIFKTSAAEMIVKDHSIVVKNRGEHVLMQFQLPDFNLQSLNGTYGSGPDEFNDPHLVPTVDTSLIAYVYESTNQKLYRLDKKGNRTHSPFSFTQGKHRHYSDKQVVNVGTEDFMYTETSATGKSIFRATQTGDSVRVREVFNLALNPKRKSWTNYIGDFAVNPGKNRMVYAYKYFKMIKFMDMEAKTVRTINFEREEFDESSNYKVDGLDQNVTHYWGICAQPDHVYFLYSGRTPYDVGKEISKGIHYIYVEKYDWNGNPVACYKLDRWGYFTVDEKNKKLYLMSTNDDDPFFVYEI
jgi:hypothetical protein